MSNRLLTPIERASVEELRGNTRDKEAYIKMSVLVMLDEGKSYEETLVLLGLSQGSIANYRKKFGGDGLYKYFALSGLPNLPTLPKCNPAVYRVSIFCWLPENNRLIFPVWR